MTDIPLAQAMLCWNAGLEGARPEFKVFHHPDQSGATRGFRASVGACFSNWKEMSDQERRLQLMIDVWHVAAFYEVPVSMIREALLVIPEYRDMLASDCLPTAYQHERD